MSYADPDTYRTYAVKDLAADGYPPIWHTVKHEVREQAGQRCIRCGHPYRNGEHGNGEWSPCDERCHHRGDVRMSYTAYDKSRVEGLEHTLAIEAGVVVGYGKQVEARWRILTVHHLDGDRANLRWWNLVALDQRCHLEIQGKVRMERAFIFEHSGWFKPYAAGWYAHKYLGLNLTREETMGRLDELLALERLG